MRGTATSATFKVSGITATSSAQVLNENRSVSVANASFTDSFARYAVHIYKLP